MRTAGPAAGAAVALGKFGTTYLNTLDAGLCQFARRHPTNPLIASQWRDVIPSGESFLIGLKHFLNVRWGFVNGAMLNHMRIVPLEEEAEM